VKDVSEASSVLWLSASKSSYGRKKDQEMMIGLLMAKAKKENPQTSSKQHLPRPPYPTCECVTLKHRIPEPMDGAPFSSIQKIILMKP
jgi:hypothetical protein